MFTAFPADARPSSLPTAIVGAALSLVLLTACSASATRSGGHPELDYAAFYHRRCGACHVPFHPSAYDDATWEENVHHYGPRAGIPPEQRPPLIAWLQARNVDATGR